MAQIRADKSYIWRNTTLPPLKNEYFKIKTSETKKLCTSAIKNDVFNLPQTMRFERNIFKTVNDTVKQNLEYTINFFTLPRKGIFYTGNLEFVVVCFNNC